MLRSLPTFLQEYQAGQLNRRKRFAGCVEVCGIGGELASVRVYCKGALLATSLNRYYIGLRWRIMGHPRQRDDVSRQGAVGLRARYVGVG